MKKLLQLLFIVMLGVLFVQCDDDKDDTTPEKPTPTTIQLEFVNVEGGTLNLGNPPDMFREPLNHPIHPVKVNSFKISKYETTNAQFIKFLNAKKVSADGTLNGKQYVIMNGKHIQISYKEGKFVCDSGKEDYPAMWVTWEGAKAFAEFVGGRLPTEAEWEYAARGGQKSNNYVFSGSNDINEVGWYYENSYNPDNDMYNTGKGTHKVGEKKPNELGLYDMTGNVWEWCSNWFSRTVVTTPEDNPKGPDTGTMHTVRGGAYDNYARYTYVFIRFNRDGYSDSSYAVFGFRVVK